MNHSLIAQITLQSLPMEVSDLTEAQNFLKKINDLYNIKNILKYRKINSLFFLLIQFFIQNIFHLALFFLHTNNNNMLK